MYFQWSSVCFLLLLISLNTDALTFIPSVRHVIKENGTTQTISRYIVRPEDEFTNKTTFDDKEYLTKVLGAFKDQENSNEHKGKVDRYRIYIKRKFRHSKPLVKSTTSNESGSGTSEHHYSVEKTRFLPNTVQHHYQVEEGARLDNTENSVSAKTAVEISNKLQEEGESSEASNDLISKEEAAGGIGVESNRAQSVNKNEVSEIKHNMETSAAYVDLTKPLNYEDKELFETPGAIDESGTINTLLQNAQINHSNEQLPVEVNGNMHTVYEGAKNEEERSYSEEEDAELHKQHVPQEINPLNIETHNLLQSLDVSQTLETSSKDLSGQNVDQTSQAIDNSKDQDHPLMRHLVLQNVPSFSAYNSYDNKNFKSNPLNNHIHLLHGYDNILDDQVPHAVTSETISSSYSYSGSPYSTYPKPGIVDRSNFSGKVPHVYYGEISTSPQSVQQFVTEKFGGGPHKHDWNNFHKVTGNANVPNNPYYGMDTNGILIETNGNNLGYNKVNAEFLQQEQKKHLGRSFESNESLLKFLNKDSALFSSLRSPKQHQRYSEVLHIRQNNPVKVGSDYVNQEHSSQLLPIDTSFGDNCLKERLHIPSRQVTLTQRHKPSGYITKEQLYGPESGYIDYEKIHSPFDYMYQKQLHKSYLNHEQIHSSPDYNGLGDTPKLTLLPSRQVTLTQRHKPSGYITKEQLYGPESGYIDYEKIHSPFDYLYQKQLHKSYSNHEQIHSSPDYNGLGDTPKLTLLPTDHIDKKELDIYPETDDNIATKLYILLKQHRSDLEPIPNIHLFTLSNLQKHLKTLERNPKFNEDVDKFKFYKIIKLLITILKAQVEENDASDESSWFNQFSPSMKYRIQEHVYNLLKETWFQEILIELEKNNYNFNILKESWQIPVNVFDADVSDVNIENMNNYDGEEFASNTDQEHVTNNSQGDEDGALSIHNSVGWSDGLSVSSGGSGGQILTDLKISVANYLSEKGYSNDAISNWIPKLFNAMSRPNDSPCSDTA